jgi:hypothetical protein
MTYCHSFYLVMWKKNRNFRVVVGGSVHTGVNEWREKKVKKTIVVSNIFRILVV